MLPRKIAWLVFSWYSTTGNLDTTAPHGRQLKGPINLDDVLVPLWQNKNRLSDQEKIIAYILLGVDQQLKALNDEIISLKQAKNLTGGSKKNTKKSSKKSSKKSKKN